MNQVALLGRLTKEPDVRYTQDGMAIARYTLAVDRRGKDNTADFINCIAFGKSGEFAQKYLKKGMKIAVTGRIQTGSYQKQDGTKVYTTDVVIESHEFCEKLSEQPPQGQPIGEGFMTIPDGVEAEGLPWN